MKKYRVVVNGTEYEVGVELLDETEASKAPVQTAASAPAPKAAAGAGELVKAPMPGTILSVKVKEGQTVKKGDVLVVLEAMKM